ncbi:MAG: AI-2E family transporter [Methylobacteriaceae bacterium]|nr:AI-2E family transporter [Methylobacteriaceae bacterium]
MMLHRQIFFWLGILATLILALYVLSDVLLPFVAGLGVAYVVDPLVRSLHRLGINRLAASLLILGVVGVIFIATLTLIAPVLLNQLGAFVERLPDYVNHLRSLAAAGGKGLLGAQGHEILKKLGLDAAITSDDVQRTIDYFVGQGTQWLTTFVRSLWFGGAVLIGILSLIVVTPVVAFYILLDWDGMIRTLDSWVPPAHQETIRHIMHDMDAALAGFVRGQLLVCLCLGLWYALGLSLIGLDFGFLIGIAGGLLSFIPYVGSLTALVFSSGVALVQGWPHGTLLFMTLAVVLSGQFLEANVLTPRLVGASIGLHPVWLMLALFAFGDLFGFTGLMVAVPVAAAIGVLARHALRSYLASAYYLEGAGRLPVSGARAE